MTKLTYVADIHFNQFGDVLTVLIPRPRNKFMRALCFSIVGIDRFTAFLVTLVAFVRIKGAEMQAMRRYYILNEWSSRQHTTNRKN